MLDECTPEEMLTAQSRKMVGLDFVAVEYLDG
jgi:hypothetical protein